MSDPREYRWHRHPVLVATVAAVLSFVLAIIAGKTGNLPEALAPAPAEPVTSTEPLSSPTVTVTVTASPSSTWGGGGPVTYLAELDTVQGSLRAGALNINGTPYGPESLYEELGGCQTDTAVTWDLSRDFREFQAIVGVSDDSQPDTQIRFRTLVDNNVVPEAPDVTLSKGEQEELDVPVDNALELRLEAALIAGDMDLCSNAGKAAWGDPALVR